MTPGSIAEPGSALTVLGPVPAHDLGAVVFRETLLSVVPGADLDPGIDVDQAALFDELRRLLLDFRQGGGGTVVDRGGMALGRDPLLYRLLSEQTGVHIVASTGFGPQRLIGSHFWNHPSLLLDPPKPMPVDYLADLFAAEVEVGMVVPTTQRSGPAGMICLAASPDGITDFERFVYRAAARAAVRTGVTVAIQLGSDARTELEILEGEGLPPNRVIVGDLDRTDAADRGDVTEVTRRGAVAALDHAGWPPNGRYMTDDGRARMVLELFDSGVGDQIIVANNSVGVAVGHERPEVPLGGVLRDFMPVLRRSGGTDAHERALLHENPQRLLAMTEQHSIASTSREG